MHKKGNEDFIEVLWVKISTQILIIVLCLVFVILAPKKVFDDNLPFKLATSMAMTNNDNLILYDYKVYSTEDRFNQGLIDDMEEVKQTFISRNEIMAVKIYGETTRIEVREDYIFIYSPLIPDLNIEYYLVKNMIVAETSIPCRTFIMLFDDLSALINNIYLIILIIISIVIVAPTSIRLTRNIIRVKKTVN